MKLCDSCAARSVCPDAPVIEAAGSRLRACRWYMKEESGKIEVSERVKKLLEKEPF